MLTERVVRALVITLAALTAALGGCANPRHTRLALENQSSATLDVVAALPGKAKVFKTRPTHEGYVARLAPNEFWESTPDTTRSAVESNDARAVRLVVTDVTDRDRRVPMRPILVEPRGRRVQVRFFGAPGGLRYEVVDRHGAAVLAGDLEEATRR